MPIAAAPEKRTTPRASSTGTKKPAATVGGKRQTRETALTELGDVAAAGLMISKQYADAGAVSQHWPRVAHELAAVADDNEGVAAFLDRLTQTGPYAGLFLAIMPLALQIAANHGRVDADKMGGAMGIMPPAQLEALVKAKAEQQHAAFQAELTKNPPQFDGRTAA